MAQGHEQRPLRPGRLTRLRPELAAVIGWWEANRRELPWRSTRDPYAVWVAEVMSAQTQVERAARAWRSWIARWPTIEGLAAASLAEVLIQWQGLGYPRRARDLHRAARIVAQGGWPDDLTALPGIGRYTADAIRCFAWEEPVLPRDVNVVRVLSRRFPDGIDGSEDPWRTGQALMEFGQRICAARPACAECPVRPGCRGGAPADASRRSPRRFAGSLRQRRGLLLRQVLQEGAVLLAAADHEAALSLQADGLVAVGDDAVRPPGEGHLGTWSATSSAARSRPAAKSR